MISRLEEGLQQDLEEEGGAKALSNLGRRQVSQMMSPWQLRNWWVEQVTARDLGGAVLSP